MQQLVGQSLDRYRIDALQGEGGMGAVFKAHDVTLQRDVAVKIMHPHFARQANFRERFLQEARTAARLDHPGIVSVHDFGQDHDLLYIIMEFIPGANLRQMLQDLKAQDQWTMLRESVLLVSDVCRALDYAHQHGVLHRDIKPDNIMLKPRPNEDPPYQAIITDLGLAKLAEGGMLTMEGTTLGTPAYMSPEQALGERTDARSDVYSLGILLYELSAGQLPFPAKTISEAIRYHVRELPPPPRTIHPDLPGPLERIILKALEKKPSERFPDAMALARALDGVVPTEETVSAPPTAFAGAVSLVTHRHKSRMEPRGPSIFEKFPPTPPGLDKDRISVLYPDGRTQSMPVEADRLILGRARDSSVVLDHPSVSRRHARIDFIGAEYTVTDLGSTNGTFLEEVKLLPGVPETWAPERPLRMGRLWLRLEQVEKPTAIRGQESDAGLERTRLRTAARGGRLGLFAERSDLRVEAGSSVAVQFTLLNQGSVVDHFDVTVLGIPARWVTLPTDPVRLLPDEQFDVSLAIQPPRVPESRAGDHPLTIRVTSQLDAAEVAELEARLSIAPFVEYDFDLRPQKQRGILQGTFRLQASNRGNTSLTLELEAWDPEDGCLYRFNPTRIEVPAGEAREGELRLQPRTSLSSLTTRAYRFAVRAQPDERPELAKEVQGEWVQVPPVFDLKLSPPTQTRATEAVFSVRVGNRGQDELKIKLHASDAAEECLYVFAPEGITVPVGHERQAELRVRAQTPLPDRSTRRHRITVTARPVAAPLLTWQSHGEWVEIPSPRPVAADRPVARAQPTPPPRAAAPVRPTVQPRPAPPPAPAAPAKLKPRRFWGIVVFLLGLVLTFVAGIAGGSFGYDLGWGDDGWICASAVWLAGLVLTILITRRVWRRK